MTKATTLNGRPLADGARNLFATRRAPKPLLGLADLAEPPCPGCRAGLNVHQPEPDQPDRLLGTCPGCGLWSLIVVVADDDQVALYPLPDPLAPRASESA